MYCILFYCKAVKVEFAISTVKFFWYNKVENSLFSLLCKIASEICERCHETSSFYLDKILAH